MKKIFKGIMPALITPLNADGKTVNEKATRDLIKLHLSQGADGFYILGSTGEGMILEEKARMNMTEIVTDEIKGKVPVICHTAAMNFEEAIRLCKHAEKAGVDALSAIPPIFFKYDENDIFKYYKTLAESTDLPFVMYNHPSANGGLSAEMVAKMFNEVDNITGVKWTVNNYYQLMRLKDMTNGEMNIINGPDEMLVCGLMAGADAGIGTTYNVMLPQFIEIYKNFNEGNIDKARQIQYKVNKVITCMIKYQAVASTKYMCKLMGIDSGEASLPIRQLAGEKGAALEKELEEIGWPFK